MARFMGLGQLAPKDAGGNYAYVTARVRAKKPTLISPEAYQRFMAMDVASIARALQEGNYKREIDELANRYAGAALIERATRLHLGRTYSEILSFATGDLNRMIGLYLQRYDVYNIKTLLRGKLAKASADEIQQALIPAGSLQVTELDELAKLGDVAEVAQRLSRTPYGAVLQAGLARGAGALRETEDALDRRYYYNLAHGISDSTPAGRTFLEWVRREIDVVNVRTALRLKLENVEEPGSAFVPGGSSFDEERVKRLLRASTDEFVHEIEESPLKEAAPGVRRTLEEKRLHPAMVSLEQYLFGQAESFGRRYPLSILPVIDFILRLQDEVDDLRAIGYGKQTGMREDLIKELLQT